MSGSLQPLVPGGEESTGALTTELWSGINRHTIRDDPGAGHYVEKRFNLPSVYATTVAQDGIYPFHDTSDTIRGSAQAGGGLVFTTAATDNNSPTIQWGGTTGGLFYVSKTSPKNWAFEAFVKIGTIIETGIVAGLGEAGMAADDGTMADNTGALADKSFIGMHGPMHASTLTVSAVYRKNGQTGVTALSGAHVPAVSTTAVHSWGMRQRVISGYNHLEFWVNRVKVKDLDLTNTTTVPEATFPFDSYLSPVFGIKAGEGGAKAATLRSIHVFQEA